MMSEKVMVESPSVQSEAAGATTPWIRMRGWLNSDHANTLPRQRWLAVANGIKPHRVRESSVEWGPEAVGVVRTEGGTSRMGLEAVENPLSPSGYLGPVALGSKANLLTPIRL
jgi:hypothetical protein